MPLDHADRTDVENAGRGRVDELDPCRITAADRPVDRDLEAHDLLDGEPPDTVHPSLGRQAQLCRSTACSR